MDIANFTHDACYIEEQGCVLQKSCVVHRSKASSQFSV